MKEFTYLVSLFILIIYIAILRIKPKFDIIVSDPVTHPMRRTVREESEVVSENPPKNSDPTFYPKLLIVIDNALFKFVIYFN